MYLVSDHENLYEKYGFRVIDRKIASCGSEEKIYIREYNTDKFQFIGIVEKYLLLHFAI